MIPSEGAVNGNDTDCLLPKCVGCVIVDAISHGTGFSSNSIAKMQSQPADCRCAADVSSRNKEPYNVVSIYHASWIRNSAEIQSV